MTLGHWRECGPALDIESVREARTIVAAGEGGMNQMLAGST